jgi:hypothetical protein
LVDASPSRPLLVETARGLFELGAALDWRSYDPYDLLLAPRAAPLPAHAPLAARALVQLGKRTGVRFRRLLRVPPHEEPKALADFLQAAAQLRRAGEGWTTEYAEVLSARLHATATRTPVGCGWGIQFPWVSRFGAMTAGEPNIYTTTVACHALLADHDTSARQLSFETALGGTRFILDGLGAFEHNGRPWLRYAAGSSSPIVNVQASSAGLFARVHRLRPDERLVEAADRAAEVVVSAQRPDGSWPYSDDDQGAFVDGFHTGFTLEGLADYVRERRAQSIAGAVAAVERGFSYFKLHLLTADGLPRGFADGRASADGQTVAQAIQTLVSCGGQDELDTAMYIWCSTRKGRLLERPFPALRWTVGPFAAATASLVSDVSS